MYLRRQQRVQWELGVDLVRERLEEFWNRLFENWFDFGQHHFPVVVQKQIQGCGQSAVVEQIVQLDIGVSNLEVHIEVGHAQMNLAGFSRLITLGLNGDKCVNVREVSARLPVSSYGQHQNFPLHVVPRGHFETWQVQFQFEAVLVDVNSRNDNF